jgi:hypothetical protein
MTSRSFRRSRQNKTQKQKQKQSRKGGYASLMNAASASVLPLGLTLMQQRLKKQNGKKQFQKTMRNMRRYSPIN